jgi:7,8-dihydropterin-6-yl-methyl-4-(beta-D-ribofuranosyl)aminobenzene 5'-phosphate synthase
MMQRRTFLKLGAVASGAFFLGGFGQTGRASVTSAQGIVPTVDRLVMTNVVDNVYDVFARGGKLRDIVVQRTGLPWPTESAPKLLSEHGLAYHLESTRGDERAEILLDFALTGSALLNNYSAVKINPARASALIVSHGHTDHFGGMLDMARSVKEWATPGLTVYAGGEDTFCHRWVVGAEGQRADYGQLDRPALEALGFQVVLARQPNVVAGHALTSGQIPRITDFESSPANARIEAGEIGSGCEASLHFPAGTVQVEAQPGELVQDIFWGEQATAYHVAGRGLVIISSCGHAGIINTVRQVQAATGIEKVHAVMGGWHLAPAPDATVARTVDALKQIDPDYLIPMHCTGPNTIAAIQRELPDKLVMPSTGTRIVFGA